MVSDRDRHELFLALRDRLGPGPADTLMDMLPPAGWADVARKADIDRLDAARKADVDRLDAKIEHLFARIVYANVVSMFGVAGLVLAATSIA